MLFLCEKNTKFNFYPWIGADYKIFYFFNTKRGDAPFMYLEHEKVQFYENLKPCIPSKIEQKQLKEFYDNFCTEHKQDKDPNIIKCIEDLEYNKEQAKRIVDNTFKDFENNLKNDDMFFISSLGFKVNGDRRTITNLSTIIDQLLLKTQQASDQSVTQDDPLNEKIIEFMDFNDEKHVLSFNDLVTLKDEHARNGQALYNQKWEKLEQIKNAQDFNGLQVDLSYHMQDFSTPARSRKKRALDNEQINGMLVYEKEWSNTKNEL